MTSFHALVAAYSGDVPPRTVLDELRRANCVTVENDVVQVTDNAYGPYAPSEDFISAAGLIMGALGDTTDFNTAQLESGQRRLMRAWYQNNIPIEKLPEATALITENAVRFGRHLDNELARLAHRERRPGQIYKRVGLGAFYFEQ